MRRFILRLLNVFRRERAERDLAREVDAHLALLEEEHRRRGLTPGEARLAARRAMGSVALAKDLHRDARSFGWLEDVLTDVKQTVRNLRRTPSFTAIAVLTLALGVGANSAIFSVVNAVLLRPLPFEHSDRLVRIVMTIPAQITGSTEMRDTVRLTPMEVEQLRTSARTLSMVGVAFATTLNLRGRDPRLQGAVVSAAFFESLRARPLLGRVLTAGDEAAGAQPVILLSYDTWRRHFGEDPQIVGRTVTIDPVLGPRGSTNYTVVGVMPADFQFPSRATRAWTPPRSDAAFGQPFIATVARLADGVSLAAAESEILPLIRQIRAEYRDNANADYELVSVQRELVRPVRPALIVLMVAVGFVLLLACVNVANLLLARTAARQREIAIRGALGAGRGRLVRYFLTESITLALGGGLVGVLLAFGGVQLVRSLTTTLARIDLGDQLSIPRIDEIGVDWTVLGFSFGISLATGVLFGLAPALRYARAADPVALREGERATSGGHRLGRYVSLRSALVVAEIGLAMVLLACGGLLVRSFVELSRINTGYDPSNVVTFQVAVPSNLYPPARTKAFSEELVTRLQSVAGVESAGYANQLPMVNLVNSFPLAPRPRPRPRPEPGRPPERPSGNVADIRLVSRDYVRAMGMRMLSGRGFVEGDGATAPRVMLINEALAKRDFANRNPIGETVFINSFPEPWQIVGVIGNVRQFGLSVEPTPQFFVDMRQWTYIDALVFPVGAYYAVRTARAPESIVATVRGIVEQMDPQASPFYVASMEEVVASTISRPRLYATLLGTFSLVGLGLAVIGIYGVMSYSVAQRTREIGIRLALGARPVQVIALVVKQSAMLTGLGIALGLSGAALMSRYLEGMLFGVTPLDPVTFGGAAATFVLVALVAAYGPTRRATGVDPLVALRAE